MATEKEKTKVEEEEEEIPEEPPAGLKQTYLKVSRSYVKWCMGMLIWTLFCVIYSAMAKPIRMDNVMIGVCLGVLLVAMVMLPTLLFGGVTWYKRLAWDTVLSCLFAIMFAYPTVICIMGTIGRIREGRYSKVYFNDILQIGVVIVTLSVHAWTIWVAWRAVKLVRKLARGEWGQVDVSGAVSK